jgi:Protein of unknown function
MHAHDYHPDEPLTPEQVRIAEKLSPEQLRAVDQVLISYAAERWRKVAFIVGSALSEPACKDIYLPDVFYVSRLRLLVACGVLDSFGDLAYMRYSEVRLARSELS